MDLLTGWAAVALVYSGRPDPKWAVEADLADELENVWLSLPLLIAGVDEPRPSLGYRGCCLVAPDGRRWTAYRRSVELVSRDSREVRDDKQMKFEARVLASAAPGVLPPWVVVG